MITNVVFTLPSTPIEEFKTLKFPDVPVEIAIEIPAGLLFNKVTETLVVKTWNAVTVNDAANVVVEAVTSVVCVLAPKLLFHTPASIP